MILTYSQVSRQAGDHTARVDDGGGGCIPQLGLDECGQDVNISAVLVHACVYVLRGSEVAQSTTASTSRSQNINCSGKVPLLLIDPLH